jgi:hypothetical protein
MDECRCLGRSTRRSDSKARVPQLRHRRECSWILRGRCQGRHRGFDIDVCRAASTSTSVARLSGSADFEILEEQISREPLASFVRQDDRHWFVIVRWTILALIHAEELGVTSANTDDMKKSARAAFAFQASATPAGCV